MRVQQYVNAKMRPGNLQKTLERLWARVRALIIEEVSMVSAGVRQGQPLPKASLLTTHFLGKLPTGTESVLEF